MPINYYFWFSQPSTILNQTDFYIGYFFAACLAVAIIFLVIARFAKHQTIKNIWKRIWHLSLTLAISGGFWFLFRYENTPLFSRRFWVGLIGLMGIVWLIFILKYLIFNFAKEKKEYEHEQMRNKYIPSRR
ncbi:MAG: hypothetical protein A3B10_02635 [Candidatus Doudnabacteria bacterium RIFCSPLOWO2_01_FULL_44_21]|uniref:DUF5671 domain-containing protein n=1 Tax=Candidatus Doudnabacteria bacterium RIFCSPLOWO2_01_FULL_44_21 TaxID=1817841 RepID=A0A1F5Q242_9BACT|nr:MAG: hypothetical protein A3B95_02905 [Candidatus Doudnabacteria bacterium RIFCSPHIGHO2_02_FULL_43_13b]OGE96187.1 MAG: hypothetical protein A3B10_02635 [Candidatus Doudnabacteria bacterium RIFCSPLOWO2_01_FULL_44_21]